MIVKFSRSTKEALERVPRELHSIYGAPHVAGAHARRMMMLARLLPDRAKDALVRRFFGL